MLFSFIEFILCFSFIPNVVTAAVSSTTIGVQATDLSKLQRNLKRKRRTKTNKKKKSGKASKSNKVPSLCDNQTQEDALLAFKAGISDDPNGIMSNWIPDSPVCNSSTTTWGGVTCVNNQMTKLQLGMYHNNKILLVSVWIVCNSFLTSCFNSINSRTKFEWNYDAIDWMFVEFDGS